MAASDMVSAIAHYCRQTGQAEPGSPAEYVRAILESLAFKYRRVLDSLEEVTGTRFEQIRIVGGGSRNRLLNQFTANATGRIVVSGPVEATARRHRSVIPGRTVRAVGSGSMGRALSAVSRVRGVDLCLIRRQSKLDS